MNVHIRDDMKNKITALLFLLVIFGNLVYAQEAKVKLNHIGYGETTKEAYFTIHNTGEVTVTTVSIFINGKKYNEFDGVLPPKHGFKTVFYLDSGKYLIEARTPEGAYDSLNITILAVKEKTTIQPDEKLIFIQENKMWIGFMTLIVILVIGVWLLTKKPELKF